MNRLNRREFLAQGGKALAGWTLINTVNSLFLTQAFPSQDDEELIPFLDQPPESPSDKANQLDWRHLDSWITPNEKFFRVSHYTMPQLNELDWKLEVSGLVKRPLNLTLSDIKNRPRQEVTFTLECSGNHGFPTFTGAIGTAKWAGTPLAPILEEAGVLEAGIEAIFFGSDKGEEEVRKIKMPQNFARSMSLTDAMNPANLLCYEMNGEPLPQPNGYPLRLIAPSWYGIANVKWLKRIEVRNTRFMGRFMARDYVTIREEKRDGESVWVETSVGKTLIKSVTAKVTRLKESKEKYRIYGAAWGAPIQTVEVRIDEGPWLKAIIDRGQEFDYAWKFWHLDWENPTPGEHAIVSRAIDNKGNIQPAAEDPIISGKRTYWESNGQVARRIKISQ